jgi:trehalose 6-phosphate phosphatase
MIRRPPQVEHGDALFLDFDGTLAEFADRPDDVVVDSLLVRQIERLCDQLGGALAVVTGRALEDIDRLLAPAHLLGAGLHGAQLRLPDGERWPKPLLRNADALIASLHALLPVDSAIWIENKRAAVAVHYRLAPNRRSEILRAVRIVAAEHGLDTVDGKLVFELRIPEIDKGRAIQSMLLVPPFKGRRPVFVGDDTTDEDGFAAVEGAGGFSVKVGIGPSGAQFRLDDVPDVHRWLAASAANDTTSGQRA